MVEQIASLSMAMSQQSLQTSVSTAVAKKAMDVQEIALQGMVEMLQAQPMPQQLPKGQYIDMYI